MFFLRGSLCQSNARVQGRIRQALLLVLDAAAKKASSRSEKTLFLRHFLLCFACSCNAHPAGLLLPDAEFDRRIGLAVNLNDFLGLSSEHA